MIVKQIFHESPDSIRRDGGGGCSGRSGDGAVERLCGICCPYQDTAAAALLLVLDFLRILSQMVPPPSWPPAALHDQRQWEYYFYYWQ